MIKISLSSYVVRIKNIKSNKYLKLDEVLPKKDFLTFVQDYFAFIEKRLDNDKTIRKLVRVNTKKIQTIKRQIKGILETGDYGFESEFIDSEKGDLRFKRSVNDAELLPFYFTISLPKDKDKGIIVLQRFGQFGVSKILRNSLNKFLQSKDSALRLEFNPLIPQSVVENFVKKGSVTKIIFKRFDIPSDLAGYFDSRNSKEVKGNVEFRITAQRNKTLPIAGAIKKLLTGGKGANKLLEINNVSYNSAKIEVTLGNDRRLIDLGDFGKFKAYYDVTGQVKTGADGHPIFSSIDAAASKLLNELNEMIYPLQDVR